jgi:FkbM family methyltransferase
MLVVIVISVGLIAGLLAASFLTLRSPVVQSALKPTFRYIAYRYLTAIGRNRAGAGPEQLLRMVVIAKTQRGLRHSPASILHRDGTMILVDTPLGRFWIPETDREGHDGFLLMVAEEINNHYQFEAASYVLDCGANLGTFTRLALNRGARVVVAVEPAPEVVRCLRRTFAQEISQGRVILEEKGLWNKEDRLFLQTSEQSWNNTIVASGDGQPGVWVSLTTIDTIVTELGLPSVDFIKMDIEGAEIRALAGAESTIRRWRPVLSVATEHTEEKVKNAYAVVGVVKEFGPYSETCIKAGITRTRPILGARFPSLVEPEIMLLRPSFHLGM